MCMDGEAVPMLLIIIESQCQWDRTWAEFSTLDHSRFLPSGIVEPMSNDQAHAMPQQCMFAISLCVHYNPHVLQHNCKVGSTKHMGENLKVVWAKFSTFKLFLSAWVCECGYACLHRTNKNNIKVKNSAQTTFRFSPICFALPTL
jgi:hypothetical protein